MDFVFTSIKASGCHYGYTDAFYTLLLFQDQHCFLLFSDYPYPSSKVYIFFSTRLTSYTFLDLNSSLL